MTEQGALAGVRVIEFEAIGPVPLAATILADMGAEVVRITRPKRADDAWDDVGGSVLHRGRRTIELNLKTQCDQALELVARADIVLEGMRPGVMERLGLGPDACFDVNPALVYGRMTGWGQDGPLAQQAGHDLNYLSITGALWAMGSPGSPPPVPLNLVGDYGGGSMFLLTGVLAAMASARTSGKGQVVDAAMVDGITMMTSVFHAWRASGMWRDGRGDNLIDGGAPFYRCYECADGEYIAVGPLEPAFFRAFLRGLGLPEDTPQNDRATWPEMAALFAERIAQRTRDEWAQVFDGTDACVTPVLNWEEAERHPHNVARGTFVEQAGVVQPSPAPRMLGTPSSIHAGSEPTVEEMLARWTR
ncbi:CoA transferase [Altererythrobacter sp. FM1]|uniref:CaiB/BaiF CoA transferase family protein n=1 Tax=Tsuneonella flava TaxID=2055955 RepID=UPI000C800666|nr:CaiB/BaiF CoA-transferase family protein [Tsuneonella flava]ROT97365.1 CoA transferase [Altererythrobacter sp. FM1]